MRALLFIYFLKIFSDSVASASSYTAISTITHNSKLFTQGLQYYNGYLYESGGNYGSSSIQIIHPDSGEIVKQTLLEKKYFAEGITVVNNLVYMLTWREKTMLVFDAVSLKSVASYSYVTSSGEGWGLAFDGTHLLASDGSDVITFFELPTPTVQSALNKVREIRVVDPATKRSVSHINELEFFNGYIYANIWYVDILIKIDPSTGSVVHKYDFRDLFPKASRGAADCFNGIAYNETGGFVLVTGKWWPAYYKVHLHEKTGRRSRGLS